MSAATDRILAAKDGEKDLAVFLRAWDAAEDGLLDCPQGRVLRAVTLALEGEGLTSEGKITRKGKALLRRVDASTKIGGAS